MNLTWVYDGMTALPEYVPVKDGLRLPGAYTKAVHHPQLLPLGRGLLYDIIIAQYRYADKPSMEITNPSKGDATLWATHIRF
jgi:hypothetical protein